MSSDEKGTGLGGRGFCLSDFLGAEAAGEVISAGGGFGQPRFGLAQAGAHFRKIEPDQRRFGVDDRAFLCQYLGNATADLRSDFDAAGFDDAIDGHRGSGTVDEPPPAKSGGGDRDQKQRQAARDHLTKGYSKR